MRQLGGRLPEPPQLKTDAETLPEAEPQQPPAASPEPQQQQVRPEPEPLQPHEVQQPEPYPVEVHRIERQRVESRPTPAPPPAAAEPVRTQPAAKSIPAASIPPAPPATEPVRSQPAADSIRTPPTPQPASVRSPAQPAARREESAGLRITEAEAPESKATGGRWEEFGEFRRLEQGRGNRINLEPMMGQPLHSRGLLGMDQERERRSSFLTIAVPGIAAVLAIGAIVWSGSLRDRLRQQDEQMTALQEQNRKLGDKLADTLAQVGPDQKTPDALNPDSAPTSTPAEPNASNPPANPGPPKTADTAQPAPAQSSQSTQAESGQPAPAQPSTQPAPAQTASAAPASKQPPQAADKREGVSAPPPMRASAQRGSPGAADPNYHPMIVPPYPTSSNAEKVGGAAASQAAPSQQAYRESFPVNGSNPASGSTAASPRNMPSSSRTSQPAGVNSVTNPGYSSSPPYVATSNGMYASALAQNIEAVESLQRQSTVPLREFHASDGTLAKVTPGVTVSIRSPDQTRGTYALLVNNGGQSYQLRGYVNRALAFNDSVTHRGYELVVLHIAGGQAYGYVRPMQ